MHSLILFFYLCRDSFICVPYLVHAYVMTNSYVCHESFTHRLKATNWQSTSSLACLSAVGNFHSNRVSLTAGAHASSASASFSVDSKLISGLIRTQNSAVTGSTSVTLGGSGFGGVAYTVQVSV